MHKTQSLVTQYHSVIYNAVYILEPSVIRILLKAGHKADTLLTAFAERHNYTLTYACLNSLRKIIIKLVIKAVKRLIDYYRYDSLIIAAAHYDFLISSSNESERFVFIFSARITVFTSSTAFSSSPFTTR